MIGIRADANDIIAKGHIMRCIAIAQQLKKLEEQVVFITADEYAADLIAQRGYPHICLHTDWQDKNQEIEPLIQCIEEHHIDKLLVDSYEVTMLYLKQIKRHTKLIYIDDLYRFQYSVDALINYSIHMDESKYSYLHDNVMKLFGNSYIPLREEFTGDSITINDTVSKVLITTGGSDNYFITKYLIERILEEKKYQQLEFHLVIGEFFKNTEELDRLSQKAKNIILHYHVTDMSKIMRLCDVAIAAGGTTLAELSFLGIPTISFVVADNQLNGVKAFVQKCMMPTVGDIRGDVEAGTQNIVTLLNELCQDKERRARISQMERACIDGNGARRIAEGIKSL